MTITRMRRKVKILTGITDIQEAIMLIGYKEKIKTINAVK